MAVHERCYGRQQQVLELEHYFLEGEAERRANLTIITGAQAARVVLQESSGKMAATGVEYRTADGQIHTVCALKEVLLSAGAVGSPHLLMLSGIGPAQELQKAGISCLVDSPHVGKHLKDHIQVPLFFHSSVSRGRRVLRQSQNRPFKIATQRWATAAPQLPGT